MPPRRPARAPARSAARSLTEQDIVDAALLLIRKHGCDKLSMRALATQLGVTPMAIYHHVPNKESLLDLAVDAVLATVPRPSPTPDEWQKQMKTFAVMAWNIVSSYPGLSQAMLTRRRSGRAGRALVRHSIAILLAGGFDEREAALALAAYNTYLYGAYAALNAPPRSRAAGRTRPDAGRSAGAADDAVEAVARQLRDLRIDDWLDYGIDALLDGIAARAGRRRVARRQGARAQG